MTPKSAKTPNYVASLLTPRASSPKDRSVWAIGLGAVWVPFFTATSAQGQTSMDPAVLGAPLRLAKNEDGTPKFSKAGRPVIRVHKDMAEAIRLVRENFVYGLQSYTEGVKKTMPAEFKAVVDASEKAGAPIRQSDQDTLTSYLASLEDKAAAVSEAADLTGAPTAEGAAAPEKELAAA